MPTKPLIDEATLERLLQESPAPRVTDEQIQKRIAITEYLRPTETMTMCIITLDNGFSVQGISACVNPENYREDLGKKIAHDNAYRQLWALFGFLLAEKNLLVKKAAA